jgi:trimethylamine--corrinoid protein Co-methyltransferase
MSSRLPVQRPFAQPRMIYKPTEVVSADELEMIHHASLRILAEIGMDFLDPESRDLLAAAGAEVEPGGNRVRFDPELVTDLVKTCPPSFQMHSWNPDHTLTIGGDHFAFGQTLHPVP